jgi:hypothetical protein
MANDQTVAARSLSFNFTTQFSQALGSVFGGLGFDLHDCITCMGIWRPKKNEAPARLMLRYDRACWEEQIAALRCKLFQETPQRHPTAKISEVLDVVKFRLKLKPAEGNV